MAELQLLQKHAPNRAYKGKHAAPPKGGRTSGWFGFMAHWERVEQAPPPRVALLYDAENMGSAAFPSALAAAEGIGDVRIARVYGGAESIGSKRWTKLVQLHGAQRILCGGYSTGKNSADIRLVVDAMDLLAQDAADDFIIASSDSDFAPLACRLREAGKRVHSFGKGKRAVSYSALCDSTRSLTGSTSGTPSSPAQHAGKPSAGIIRKSPFEPELLDAAITCVQKGAHGEPWCDMAMFSMLLYKAMPDFTPKSHGCKNMTAFARKTGLFEVRQSKGTYLIRLRKQ